MDYRNTSPQKVLTAEEAIAKIKTGSRVFIGTGCGEPQHLIHTMVAAKGLYDIWIYQMLSFTLAEYIEDKDFHNRFSLKLFFISRGMRKAAFEGKIDYIPAYLSQIPRMFDSRQIGLDVALVQISPPDKHGYCSLGVSVDITSAGMKNASIVIAQVNPKMVRTGGDSNIHIDEIDYLVPHEEKIVEYLPDRSRDSSVAKRIGHYVSQMVDDGATLQVGFGSLPGRILQSLLNKKDLGVHTQVITDAFLPLLKKKIITCKRKNYLSGRIVGSLCMGREELYEYVDDNPLFYFRSSEFVNDPNVIAKNDKLISISSALEADLTGQVCSDSVGHLFYSGIGDQVDFLRGSAMSKGGFSIIALPSTAQNEQISRIVPFLNEGAGVATTRGDVHYIVTEYGVAALKGKSIYQRAMEMAQIAHPKFRKDLIEQAKKLHYIFVDQIPPSQDDLIFLEEYKTIHKLRDGRSLEIRPIMSSDEFSSRNFYYSLQENTIYHRYFYKRKIFGHKEVQNELANVDYHQNMTLIGLVMQGGHKEIMAVASYAQETDSNLAEVAFVVGENFQGLGVATIMMSQLEKIARQNGFTGFTAIVLSENIAMQHVFKKRYPDAKIKYDGSEVYFTMMFDL